MPRRGGGRGEGHNHADTQAAALLQLKHGDCDGRHVGLRLPYWVGQILIESISLNRLLRNCATKCISARVVQEKFRYNPKN